MKQNQNKTNTIFVTGSSGRIGGAIAAELQKEYAIIGIDVKPGPYTTHVMDIRSSEVERLVEHTHSVIHTAALHAPHVGVLDDMTFWDINVHGTENLLKACLKHKIQRF